MTAPSQADKAEQFRALHTGPRILALPNAWDAISARIFEAAGFPAVGTTSAGLANVLGYPDGQYVPREEMLFMVRRIAQTVQVPVTADIEAGYGINSVAEVVETVKGVLAAGAVGINLEDSDGDVNGTLAEAGLQVEKIAALRALAQSEGVPLVINARTDAFHLASLDTQAKLALAVERANLYREAGADCLFVPFVNEASVIAQLAQAINGPLNILVAPGVPDTATLEKMGVARLSVGSGPKRATLGLVRRIAEELRDQGTYTSLTEGTIPYPEINRLLAPRE
ncbi:MAG TPA: isocitrate lyase/phosphoenolpyruvate mutase family protein [Chthonomonadaceae bacterium]|nr:isocitrate lyase/phosphoenolpyruvate mutase family protein [Chthonomonadaceae bacterium]